MSNELEATKMKLRMAEDKLSQPSPHLIQLENEMTDMKIQHRLAIQKVFGYIPSQSSWTKFLLPTKMVLKTEN